ncbi:MAG: peptidoglycan DD-metalloendopeptidase family protein [Eubacterium sp.]|nr:peptidoglycan DD-metalloendopeptidase family protein [Eubacterium sp.]
MSKLSTKILSLAMSAVLAVTGFSYTLVAQAKTTAELQSEKQKIQSEINEAQSKIDALSGEKAETQEYLDALSQKINLLQDKIDNLESDKASLQAEINSIQVSIDQTVDEIETAQEQIDEKQNIFDGLYDLYCERLRAMYVSGSVSSLEVIMTCPDMSSMLTRSQMIKSVSEKDSAALDELITMMEEIEAQKQALEVKRSELNQAKEDLEADKSKLQASINEISTSKSELDSQAAEANALMKKLSSQTSEYMELIETNREELQAVQNEINAAISNQGSRGGGSYNGSSGSGSGQLSYPTDYRTISAGYPNYASGAYHGGVDFPCPSGSNVYAAGSGKVILVKYLNYSYGYHVVIDHGDGLSTLYAHNSAIHVSVGQTVSQGQVIASSGSTGNSTGPHCHFEVRVNGNRVNPLSYL